VTDKPTITVREFTVSYSTTIRSSNGSTNHFVSQNFSLSTPVPPDEAIIHVLHGSEHVTKSVVYTALARNDISVEEANDLIRSSGERHSKMREKLVESRAAADAPGTAT
jgi:hypothetical protein